MHLFNVEVWATKVVKKTEPLQSGNDSVMLYFEYQ